MVLSLAMARSCSVVLSGEMTNSDPLVLSLVVGSFGLNDTLHRFDSLLPHGAIWERGSLDDCGTLVTYGSLLSIGSL